MSEKELLYEKALATLKGAQRADLPRTYSYSYSGSCKIVDSPKVLREGSVYLNNFYIYVRYRQSKWRAKKWMFFKQEVVKFTPELKISFSRDGVDYEETYIDYHKVENIYKEIVRLEAIEGDIINKRRIMILNSIECGD